MRTQTVAINFPAAPLKDILAPLDARPNRPTILVADCSLERLKELIMGIPVPPGKEFLYADSDLRTLSPGSQRPYLPLLSNHSELLGTVVGRELTFSTQGVAL